MAGEDNDLMDSEAPLPYKRRGQDSGKEVKFSFDEVSTTTRVISTTPAERVITNANGVEINRVQDPDVVQTETTTGTRSKKVTLQAYSNSSEEDAEAFFHAFEKLQSELKSTWSSVSSNQNNDASVLFNAMDKMLLETANTEWHDVLADATEYPDQTWKSFKKATGKYLMSKVLNEEAYDKQRNYLNERTKPRKITARNWEQRLATLNRFMVYMFGSMEELKVEIPNAVWTDWWKQGSMTEAEIRRIIIGKAPNTWKDALKLHMVEQKKIGIEGIIGYYTTLEAFERKGIRQMRPGPKGRVERRSNKDRYGQERDRYDRRRDRYDRYDHRRNNNNNNRRNDRYDRNDNYNRRTNQDGARRFPERSYQRMKNDNGRDNSRRYDPQRNAGAPRRDQYRIEEYSEEEKVSDNGKEMTEEQAFQAWNDQWSDDASSTNKSDYNDNNDEPSDYEEEDNFYLDAYDKSVWRR